MNIRPIRTEADYREALEVLSAYFADEPDPESEDGARFWEANHTPIGP